MCIRERKAATSDIPMIVVVNVGLFSGGIEDSNEILLELSSLLLDKIKKYNIL